jgi:hypothetical protein
MSKTNRYTIHTTMRGASKARLLELREDYVRIAADRANKQRILEEAKARDQEWSEFIQYVRPLKQGKLFR